MAKSGIMGRIRNNRLDVRYVLIAKKSQVRGERKLGQMPRELRVPTVYCGTGISHHAYHGRPRWISGNIAPIVRANAVIAAAQRVTGRRHSAWTMRRMAEINVPT